MAQPIGDLGAICRRYDALLYVDATATLAGMAVPADAWEADIVTAGLQKCLGGPSGSAPITISDRAAAHIYARRHVERCLLYTSEGLETEKYIKILSAFQELIQTISKIVNETKQ